MADVQDNHVTFSEYAALQAQNRTGFQAEYPNPVFRSDRFCMPNRLQNDGIFVCQADFVANSPPMSRPSHFDGIAFNLNHVYIVFHSQTYATHARDHHLCNFSGGR